MKVALISCVKTKATKECQAKDMYQSTWFRLAYAYAKTQKVDKILILSAKDHSDEEHPERHNVLEETDIIKPYDLTLKEMNKDKKDQWGKAVLNQLAEKTDLAHDEFILLAGKAYREFLDNKLHSIGPKEIIGKRNGEQMSFFISQIEIKDGWFNASELRKEENLIRVTRKPGYYKWWAKKEELEQLFEKLDFDEAKTLSYIETKVFGSEIRYCIYVGIEHNVHDRLDWHINTIDSDAKIKDGTVSTLRTSIVSMFGRNYLDNDATNKFIDSLVVEFHACETYEKARQIEKEHLSGEKYLYILNIKENKHKLAPIKKLEDYRKKAKQSVQ